MAVHGHKEHLLQQRRIAVPVRNPKHHLVLDLRDAILHIQRQAVQELLQHGYGFLFKRQIAVILQGLAGKEYGFRLALGESDGRQDAFLQDMIPARRAHFGVKRETGLFQFLEVPQYGPF